MFVRFNEAIKFPEYKIYKQKLIKSLEPYFTNVLTNSFNPNLVGKVFSVHVSLGGTPENANKNHFYRYLSYKSSFPSDSQILNDLSRIYASFRTSLYPTSTTRNSIIVFDMDDTLIDSSTKPFYKNIFVDLQKYREYFQYIVLWTHGTTPYLSEIQLEFKFDLYMSRIGEESENKGLGAVLRELNRSHNVSKLDFCVLVDDGAFNYEKDYDLFVHVNTKPISGTYAQTLGEIVYCMNRYYRKRTFPRQITI